MNVTDGQTGANLMKNCTDKLELEFSVYNVEEIGNGILKDETSNISNDSFCRAGPHCEKCKDDYYLQPQKDRLGRQSCSPCNCNPEGSISGQCSPEGQCPCRDGVTGATCDTCLQKHWNFPLCRPCKCLPAGSVDNTGTCVQQSGTCQCKEFVEGPNCDTCIDGYFQVIILSFKRYEDKLYFLID